jgi:hypothetical protein
MKILFTIMISLGFGFTALANSAGQFSAIESLPDTTSAAGGQEERERVLHPAAHPYVFYEPYDSAFLYQSGVFAGFSLVGIEFSFVNRYRNLFGTLHAGYHLRPQNRGGMDQIYTAGAGFGRQFILHASGTSSGGTVYYARVAPGIDMASTGGQFGQSGNTFLGLQTTAIVGAQRSLGGFGSIYAETGTRMSWFPTFEEARWMGGPQLSVGFIFSGSRDIVPVRF